MTSLKVAERDLTERFTKENKDMHELVCMCDTLSSRDWHLFTHPCLQMHKRAQEQADKYRLEVAKMSDEMNGLRTENKRLELEHMRRLDQMRKQVEDQGDQKATAVATEYKAVADEALEQCRQLQEQLRTHVL